MDFGRLSRIHPMRTLEAQQITDTVARLCVEANDRLGAGQPLPIDLQGQVLYYVGPTPPRPGMVTGGAGALLSKYIRRLIVEDFPGIVINDVYGNEL